MPTKLYEFIQNAYNTLESHLPESQVILLHPESKYRSALIAKLVSDPAYRTFYYALGPDDVNLQNFIAGITHDVSAQQPFFGRHLHLLPPEIYANFDDRHDLILETFVQELTELSDEPFLLILDEYDRADFANSVVSFTQKFADRLPPHCKLIINGRSLPRLSLTALIANRQAVLLRDDTHITEKFYGLNRSDDSVLEIFGLGPGFVLKNGEFIGDWEGHLPRLLLFYTLDSHVVTRGEICTTFWPELDIDQAVNVFHVTKRRLHKALELDVLAHSNRYYLMNPGIPIQYDVMDFVEALVRGRDENNPNPFEDYAKAAQLYQGDFLQGSKDEWVLERRQPFRNGYLEAVEAMAAKWLQEDKLEIALRIYQDTVDNTHKKEHIHRNLMKVYMQLGRRSEAVTVYQSLYEARIEAGTEPQEATQDLYREIIA